MNNISTNNLINITENINANLDFLHLLLSNHKNYYKEILLLFKNFIEDVITKNSSNSEINIAILNLNRINTNITKVETLINELTNIKLNINTTESITLKAQLAEYNIKYLNDIKEIFNTSKDIQEYIINTLNSKFDPNNIYENNNANQNSIFITDINNNNNSNINESNNTNAETIFNFIENTLVIGEDEIVFPYTLNNITLEYKNNPDKYSSIYSVLKENYIVSSKIYKNSAFSRFKEAYKLAIKSQKRKTTAIKLAFELFANFHLHPAIITACKDLNQLDIYLSCLEYDELDDFTAFKIKYDLKPTTLSKKEKLVFES